MSYRRSYYGEDPDSPKLHRNLKATLRLSLLPVSPVKSSTRTCSTGRPWPMMCFSAFISILLRLPQWRGSELAQALVPEQQGDSVYN
ncbi:MAG: hypothetical protein ACRD2U_15685 [Terriglobales bacterium]